MENIELKIEGMHCEGCSNRLGKVLNNLEGVNSAEVNFNNATAKISFNTSVVTLDEIKEVIIDAGFNINN